MGGESEVCMRVDGKRTDGRAAERRGGFTLVEILVVVAIISLLAGVVLVNVAPGLGMGQQAAAKAQIKTFSTALETYRLAHGRYPTTEQGLEALVQRPEREPVPANYPAEGYLSSRVLPQDPWKRPYLYLSPGRGGEGYEVFSLGADGEPGGSGGDSDVSSAGL